MRQIACLTTGFTPVNTHILSTIKIHAAIITNLPIVFIVLIIFPPAYIGELDLLDTIVFENLTINKDILIMGKENENKICYIYIFPPIVCLILSGLFYSRPEFLL